MCQMGFLSRVNHLFKKMVKVQSPRVQCCMCALSVMSALFGMFMLSAGVCLVLNYNFLEVDTSGLPPDLHNEEGKKVVGIILICVGIVALGISGLVSILFYAACSRTSSPASRVAAEKGEGQGRPSSEEGHGRGHYHSNGITPARASSASATPGARRSGGGVGAGAVSNGRRSNDPRVRGPAGKEGPAYSRNGMGVRNATPPGSARPYRAGKKTRHAHGRFRNSLPSHPEEACGEGAGVSRHPSTSSSRRLAYPDRQGHVNRAAQLEDDTVVVSGNLTGHEHSATPSVVIKVDSSYLADTKTPSLPPPKEGESDCDDAAGADAASPVVTSDSDPNDNTVGVEEDQSGRVSRATVASSDTAEVVEESPEEAHKRLDTQMKTLLS